ncbi:hypothetical protein J6590_061183 [Homalodisca vitripennis]|nr:hypothetical protein J6590_061183 [Homalodisca vitripennis]
MRKSLLNVICKEYCVASEFTEYSERGLLLFVQILWYIHHRELYLIYEYANFDEALRLPYELGSLSKFARTTGRFHQLRENSSSSNRLYRRLLITGSFSSTSVDCLRLHIKLRVPITWSSTSDFGTKLEIPQVQNLPVAVFISRYHGPCTISILPLTLLGKILTKAGGS